MGKHSAWILASFSVLIVFLFAGRMIISEQQRLNEMREESAGNPSCPQCKKLVQLLEEERSKR